MTRLKSIDSKHRNLPPTAAVAKQQGQWLASKLNEEAGGASPSHPRKPFAFRSQGQMAYVGKNVSVAGLGADGG